MHSSTVIARKSFYLHELQQYFNIASITYHSAIPFLLHAASRTLSSTQIYMICIRHTIISTHSQNAFSNPTLNTTQLSPPAREGTLHAGIQRKYITTLHAGSNVVISTVFISMQYAITSIPIQAPVFRRPSTQAPVFSHQITKRTSAGTRSGD